MQVAGLLALVVLLVLELGHSYRQAICMRAGGRGAPTSSPARRISKRLHENDDGRDERGQIRFIHKAVVGDGQSVSLKLLEFVLTSFPTVKRSQAKQWLTYESILVNDEVQSKFDYELYPGDVVLIRSGKSPIVAAGASSSSRSALPATISTLFEDDHLIVLEKPSGMPMTEKVPTAGEVSLDDGVVSSLLVHVNNYLRKKKQKAFAVHQMDKGASGLAVFAKSLPAKEFLQKNWNTFGRSFVCVCDGLLTPMQGAWTTYQDESEERVKCHDLRTDAPSTAAQVKLHTAMTNFRTLQTSVASAPLRSLVELSLETSRRDQVRSQFAHKQHPLSGEDVYRESPGGGGEALTTTEGLRRRPPRLALHATEVRIVHPTTREPMTFASPFPPTLSALLGSNAPLAAAKSASNSTETEKDRRDDGTEGRVVKVLSLTEYLAKK